MSNWDSGSEEALATLVCDRLGSGANRLLIGGLGMGFTLAAALAVLPASATIVVAELVPKVVAWAQGPLAHVFGDSLGDPRVALQIGDVHDVIEKACDQFDAILLDVDNGPDGLVNLANERLYCNWGLRAAHAALRPEGLLGIWSAYRDDVFFERLQRAGFDAEEIEMDTDGDQHHSENRIWLGTRLQAA